MIEAAKVAAVLLAAGRSSRFGAEDKLLAGLAGKPLARHAAETLASLGFGALIVVARPALAHLFPGFELVANERPEEGQSRSIRLGIEAAERAGAATILIALADMPFVGADHYRRLLAVHDRVTASTAGGAPMPPALFDCACFSELMSLTGDMGARSLLGDAVLVEAPTRELRDIDAPADLNPRPDLCS